MKDEELKEECWLCGKRLNRGDWVVEINIKLFKGNKFVELGDNPYNRLCLECGLKHLKEYGVSQENLDACLNWRDRVDWIGLE